MAIINLLPPELAVKAPIGRLAAFLTRVAVVGFAIFLLSSVGAITFFIFNQIELRNSSARQENLKSSIRDLEQVEQSLVLVRDRLSRLKSAELERDDFDKFTLLVNLLGADNVSEAEITKGKVKLVTAHPSSSSLNQFMATLVTSNLYKNIKLVSLSFSPNFGYLASLELSE